MIPLTLFWGDCDVQMQQRGHIAVGVWLRVQLAIDYHWCKSHYFSTHGTTFDTFGTLPGLLDAAAIFSMVVTT